MSILSKSKGGGLPVIAVGPKGGLIVGYKEPGHVPIYQGSKEAQKLAQEKGDLEHPETLTPESWMDMISSMFGVQVQSKKGGGATLVVTGGADDSPAVAEAKLYAALSITNDVIPMSKTIYKPMAGDGFAIGMKVAAATKLTQSEASDSEDMPVSIYKAEASVSLPFWAEELDLGTFCSPIKLLQVGKKMTSEDSIFVHKEDGTTYTVRKVQTGFQVVVPAGGTHYEITDGGSLYGPMMPSGSLNKTVAEDVKVLNFATLAEAIDYTAGWSQSKFGDLMANDAIFGLTHTAEMPKSEPSESDVNDFSDLVAELPTEEAEENFETMPDEEAEENFETMPDYLQKAVEASGMSKDQIKAFSEAWSHGMLPELIVPFLAGIASISIHEGEDLPHPQICTTDVSELNDLLTVPGKFKNLPPAPYSTVHPGAINYKIWDVTTLGLKVLSYPVKSPFSNDLGIRYGVVINGELFHVMKGDAMSLISGEVPGDLAEYIVPSILEKEINAPVEKVPSAPGEWGDVFKAGSLTFKAYEKTGKSGFAVAVVENSNPDLGWVGSQELPFDEAVQVFKNTYVAAQLPKAPEEPVELSVTEETIQQSTPVNQPTKALLSPWSSVYPGSSSEQAPTGWPDWAPKPGSVCKFVDKEGNTWAVEYGVGDLDFDDHIVSMHLHNLSAGPEGDVHGLSPMAAMQVISPDLGDPDAVPDDAWKGLIEAVMGHFFEGLPIVVNEAGDTHLDGIPQEVVVPIVGAPKEDLKDAEELAKWQAQESVENFETMPEAELDAVMGPTMLEGATPEHVAQAMAAAEWSWTVTHYPADKPNMPGWANTKKGVHKLNKWSSSGKFVKPTFADCPPPYTWHTVPSHLQKITVESDGKITYEQLDESGELQQFWTFEPKLAAKDANLGVEMAAKLGFGATPTAPPSPPAQEPSPAPATSPVESEYASVLDAAKAIFAMEPQKGGAGIKWIIEYPVLGDDLKTVIDTKSTKGKQIKTWAQKGKHVPEGCQLLDWPGSWGDGHNAKLVKTGDGVDEWHLEVSKLGGPPWKFKPTTTLGVAKVTALLQKFEQASNFETMPDTLTVGSEDPAFWEDEDYWSSSTPDAGKPDTLTLKPDDPETFYWSKEHPLWEKLKELPIGSEVIVDWGTDGIGETITKVGQGEWEDEEGDVLSAKKMFSGAVAVTLPGPEKKAAEPVPEPPKPGPTLESLVHVTDSPDTHHVHVMMADSVVGKSFNEIKAEGVLLTLTGNTYYNKEHFKGQEGPGGKKWEWSGVSKCWYMDVPSGDVLSVVKGLKEVLPTPDMVSASKALVEAIDGPPKKTFAGDVQEKIDAIPDDAFVPSSQLEAIQETLKNFSGKWWITGPSGETNKHKIHSWAATGKNAPKTIKDGGGLAPPDTWDGTADIEVDGSEITITVTEAGSTEPKIWTFIPDGGDKIQDNVAQMLSGFMPTSSGKTHKGTSSIQKKIVVEPPKLAKIVTQPAQAPSPGKLTQAPMKLALEDVGYVTASETVSLAKKAKNPDTGAWEALKDEDGNIIKEDFDVTYVEIGKGLSLMQAELMLLAGGVPAKHPKFPVVKSGWNKALGGYEAYLTLDSEKLNAATALTYADASLSDDNFETMPDAVMEYIAGDPSSYKGLATITASSKNDKWGVEAGDKLHVVVKDSGVAVFRDTGEELSGWSLPLGSGVTDQPLAGDKPQLLRFMFKELVGFSNLSEPWENFLQVHHIGSISSPDIPGVVSDIAGNIKKQTQYAIDTGEMEKSDAGGAGSVWGKMLASEPWSAWAVLDASGQLKAYDSGGNVIADGEGEVLDLFKAQSISDLTTNSFVSSKSSFKPPPGSNSFTDEYDTTGTYASIMSMSEHVDRINTPVSEAVSGTQMGYVFGTPGLASSFGKVMKHKAKNGKFYHKAVFRLGVHTHSVLAHALEAQGVSPTTWGENDQFDWNVAESHYESSPYSHSMGKGSHDLERKLYRTVVTVDGYVCPVNLFCHTGDTEISIDFPAEMPLSLRDAARATLTEIMNKGGKSGVLTDEQLDVLDPEVDPELLRKLKIVQKFKPSSGFNHMVSAHDVKHSLKKAKGNLNLFEWGTAKAVGPLSLDMVYDSIMAGDEKTKNLQLKYKVHKNGSTVFLDDPKLFSETSGPAYLKTGIGRTDNLDVNGSAERILSVLNKGLLGPRARVSVLGMATMKGASSSMDMDGGADAAYLRPSNGKGGVDSSLYGGDILCVIDKAVLFDTSTRITSGDDYGECGASISAQSDWYDTADSTSELVKGHSQEILPDNVDSSLIYAINVPSNVRAAIVKKLEQLQPGGTDGIPWNDFIVSNSTYEGMQKSYDKNQAKVKL